MTLAQPPVLSDLAQALCGALVLLVPLAGAGLALMNSGLGRSRSAAHAMLAPVAVMAVAALVYGVCGWSWQSFPGRPAHSFELAGKSWNWIAAEPFFLRGLQFDGSPAALAAWLQMFSVALAAMIPLGAGSERWRLGASCASTALLAGWTYPLFAHWVWGGGWLAQRGFLDAGGSGAVQAVGGLTALSIAWILGPRQGKYDAEGMPAAFPGHNAVLVLFACFLTWLGWIGLNGAGSLLLNGGGAANLPRVAIDTTLSAAAGVLSVAALTRVRFGRPDASLCANGWTGGLVASSAACAWIAPAAAAVIGAIAGVLVTFSVEWLDTRWRVDDPAGSISVHAAGGLWGLLALAIFAPVPRENPWLGQLAGVATLLVFVLPMTYGLNWLLNRFYPQRVAADGESHGLDLYELGAGAYPEFVTRRDDFRPR
jgi:Amt family ammonium transporter